MKKSLKQWQEIEASDYFQKGAYEGGFDSTEDAFCFSYYTSTEEYWFQLTLEEIKEILQEKIKTIKIRKAE